MKRLAAIRRAHGDDAVGFYAGNPATRSYPATLAALAFARALNTRNVFSTASVDFLPRMFAAYHSFGNRALLPVPDVDRTHFLLIFGATPLEFETEHRHRATTSSRPIPVNRGMITGGVGSPVTRQRRIEVGELLRWPGVPPMAQFKDRDGNTFEIVEASGWRVSSR